MRFEDTLLLDLQRGRGPPVLGDVGCVAARSLLDADALPDFARACFENVHGDSVGGLEVLLELLVRGKADERAVEHHAAFLLAAATSEDHSPSALDGAMIDGRIEEAVSPNTVARRVMRARFPGPAWPLSLLRGLRARGTPANGGLQLVLIGLEPVDLRVSVVGACARVPEHLGIVDAGRHGAAVGECPCSVEQAPPRPRDHHVARREMFLGVIDDRPHAFRDGLVLHHDVTDAGVDLVGALSFAIDLPVVADVLDRTPAPIPVRGVG